MLDLEDDVVAASLTIDDDPLVRWQTGFEDMFGLVAGRFAQVQSRRRARLYLLGLLSGAERKNSCPPHDATLGRRAAPAGPG